jgi:hypothetical protein
MLVIFTEYDQVSKILKACAGQLVREANSRIRIKLGPPKSKAAAVRKALADEKGSALFYFGHGELPPKGLIAQDRISAVDPTNLALLRNRLVVAASCYSAQSLAGAARKHGATVIGYHGDFRVSFRSKDRKLQTKCVLSAALSLLRGSDAATASKTAIAEFDQAADAMIKGNAEDRVIASIVYRGNAQAIRLAGKNRKMG